MGWKEALTPKNTEEVRPGLFIQSKVSGGKYKYKQVYPIVWQDTVYWSRFFFGVNFWKNFLWFLIIMFMVYSYKHDVHAYQELDTHLRENPEQFCSLLVADHARNNHIYTSVNELLGNLSFITDGNKTGSTRV